MSDIIRRSQLIFSIRIEQLFRVPIVYLRSEDYSDRGTALYRNYYNI